nr:FtsW/RodA/SpoVE family cell cycle protein [Corynebacterium mendelii]
MKRLAARRTERLLFVLVLAIVAAAATATGASVTSPHYSLDTRWFIIACAVTLLVVHLVITAVVPSSDQIIMPCVALLNGVGIVMLHRLDAASLDRADRNPQYIPVVAGPSQLRFTLLGLVVFVLVAVVVRNGAKLAGYANLLGLAGLVMLLVALLWPGDRLDDTTRIWISIGGRSIQPGELAKILLIIYFAYFLSEHRHSFNLAGTKKFGIVFPRLRDVAQVVVFWGVAMVILVFQNDFGPVLLLFGTAVAMLYMATGRTSLVGLGLVLIGVGGWIMYHVSEKIQQRIQGLDPLSDPTNTTYQAAEAMFSWSWGGLTGTGLGRGWPQDVPVAHTDFILTAFGEETGLAGVSALIVVSTLIVARGLVAALAAADPFSKLMAGGFAVIMMIQLFTVVAGTSALLPMTGLTTPFVSAGGSSLVSSYILVALLMRISDTAYRGHRRPAAARRPATVMGGGQ